MHRVEWIGYPVSQFFFFTYEMVQDLRISSIFFDSISNLEAMATLSVLNIIKITTLPNHLKFFRTEVSPPASKYVFFFKAAAFQPLRIKQQQHRWPPKQKGEFQQGLGAEYEYGRSLVQMCLTSGT